MQNSPSSGLKKPLLLNPCSTPPMLSCNSGPTPRPQSLAEELSSYIAFEVRNQFPLRNSPLVNSGMVLCRGCPWPSNGPSMQTIHACSGLAWPRAPTPAVYWHGQGHQRLCDSFTQLPSILCSTASSAYMNADGFSHILCLCVMLAGVPLSISLSALSILLSSPVVHDVSVYQEICHSPAGGHQDYAGWQYLQCPHDPPFSNKRMKDY